MRQRLIPVLLAVALVGLCAHAAFAQGAYGKVMGVCKDAQGNPITGAIVKFYSKESGHVYELKTNARGEYLSIAIHPTESYTVTLLKDGKELDHVDGFYVPTGESTLDFNLKDQQQQAMQKQGMSPEQIKQMQQQMKEHEEKVKREGDTVKTLNEKLQAADLAAKAQNYDAAITVLTEASEIDASRDLIWFKLADAYRGSAATQTDPAEKSKRLTTAITDYEKAVELKKKEMAAATDKKPEATKQLAAYYNNLGDAYAKQGNTEGAVKAFNEAATADPTNAGMYYFNLGAILTNANKSSDTKVAQAAIDAFDKAIAADPNRADAYYWKGSNLMILATINKENKMVVPDGTGEAFEKYLELKPDGPHAAESKAMLDGIGSTIETSYGKKKSGAVKAPPKK